jgi:hypothetical protein
MLNTKTVITQTARRELWVNFILTLLVSSFGLVFIPFSYESPLIWFVGLSVVSYICIYYTMGFRSKITINKELKYTISIPDNSSNTSRHIPLEYITHVEICEYSLFKRDCYYPSAVNNDYYYKKTMFGYRGAGLIVCYQLPKTMTGDSIVRGIRFPSPNANEFLSFINANTLS